MESAQHLESQGICSFPQPVEPGMKMGRGIEGVDPDGLLLERNDIAFSAQRSEETAENEQGVEIIGILIQDAPEASDSLQGLFPGDEHGPDKTGI
jgi:hypothetical protein